MGQYSFIHLRQCTRVPDPLRLERCRRSPEFGPRILFFSGGTALRKTVRVLKEFTHNSIHLVTPFDSGGSSAHLREAFGMLSIGDVRNRIMALANETQKGNPAIYGLFNHRFSMEGDEAERVAELSKMVAGESDLVREVPSPMRRLVQENLGFFKSAMPASFPLAGASVGNLILVGGYLNYNRDIDSVVYLFSKLVDALGEVWPIVDSQAHLMVQLENGEEIVGQHLFTGKEEPPISSPIEEIRLVESLASTAPVQATIQHKIRGMITKADLICFPFGSFYSSIVANLLPRGVGQALRDSGAPKLYIPSLGVDPEVKGKRLSDMVREIVDRINADLSTQGRYPALDLVMLDPRVDYQFEVDEKAVEDLGVSIAFVNLTSDSGTRKFCPTKVSEALISLA